MISQFTESDRTLLISVMCGVQGRLDVHVDFKHASKWQAEGIFKNFYPTKPKPKREADGTLSPTDTAAVEKQAAAAAAAQKKNPAAPIIPVLEEEELADLAKKFAEQIPEDEMSVRICLFLCPCQSRLVGHVSRVRLLLPSVLLRVLLPSILSPLVDSCLPQTHKLCRFC